MNTQINILTVLMILLIHWIADFLCQTDKMAQGKSKNWNDLLEHTSVYSLIWLMPSILLFEKLGLVFVGITFLAHTLTDYFTSRLNTKLWSEKKIHWFFVSIGFDQFLHFTQLFLTYYLLNNLK